jgi:hypothetical protein
MHIITLTLITEMNALRVHTEQQGCSVNPGDLSAGRSARARGDDGTRRRVPTATAHVSGVGAGRGGELPLRRSPVRVAPRAPRGARAGPRRLLGFGDSPGGGLLPRPLGAQRPGPLRVRAAVQSVGIAVGAEPPRHCHRLAASVASQDFLTRTDATTVNLSHNGRRKGRNGRRTSGPPAPAAAPSPGVSTCTPPRARARARPSLASWPPPPPPPRMRPLREPRLCGDCSSSDELSEPLLHVPAESSSLSRVLAEDSPQLSSSQSNPGCSPRCRQHFNAACPVLESPSRDGLSSTCGRRHWMMK